MDPYDVINTLEAKGLYKYASELNKDSFLNFLKDRKKPNIVLVNKKKKDLEDSAKRLTKTKTLNELKDYMHSPQREKDENLWFSEFRTIPQPQTSQKELDDMIKRFEEKATVNKVARKLIKVSSDLEDRGYGNYAAKLNRVTFNLLRQVLSRDVKEYSSFPSIEEVTEKIETGRKSENFTDNLMKAYAKYADIFSHAEDIVNDFIREISVLMKKYDKTKDIDGVKLKEFADKKVQIVRKYDKLIHSKFNEMEAYLTVN